MGKNVAALSPSRTKTKPKPGTRVATVDSTGEALASLTPELVIALCGPIGSPLHSTATQIQGILGEFGYVSDVVRLSQIIRINAEDVGVSIETNSRYEEVQSLIKAGDALRNRYGHDVLAKLAIAKISADRLKKYGEHQDKAAEMQRDKNSRPSSQRICHVIDSIKNEAELNLLRLIYGDALYAIGIFSPVKVRLENLEHSGQITEADVHKLVDIDSGEEFSHGQSVRDTFPRCDYFLNVDKTVVPNDENAVAQLVGKLRRFFNLIFRTSIVTPSVEETAMYASASAARNSACISRQVGAAVTSKTGEVLAVGWNDVPRPGGGLYGKPPLDLALDGESKNDKRCFKLVGSKCHNDEEKKAVASLLVDSLVKKKLISEERAGDAKNTILSDTRIKDLIEFSRAVHAEMHAILGACRVAGDRVIGGKLFVTTYPCHSCARHIVASGISEVYFIEPYRKSLATKLHGDALSEVDEGRAKVRLLQFEGVAPRRFIDMFEAGDRKVAGVLALRSKMEAIPASHVSIKAIPRLEEAVVAEVASKHLRMLGLIGVEEQTNDNNAIAPKDGEDDSGAA